jgi:hypothetical protein
MLHRHGNNPWNPPEKMSTGTKGRPVRYQIPTLAGNGSADRQTQKYLCNPGPHQFDIVSFNSTQAYSKDKAIKYGFEHKIEKDKWRGMEVK